MRRIILDTNIYSAFKRNDSVAVNLLKRAEYIAINTVILGELLAGFRCGTKELQNRLELDQFIDSPRVDTIGLDDQTSEFYAQVFFGVATTGEADPFKRSLAGRVGAATWFSAGISYDNHFASISGLLQAIR